jgi:hypothetical protein
MIDRLGICQAVERYIGSRFRCALQDILAAWRSQEHGRAARGDGRSRFLDADDALAPEALEQTRGAGCVCANGV